MNIKKSLVSIIILLSTLACALFSTAMFARTNAALKDSTASSATSENYELITHISTLRDLANFRDAVNKGYTYEGLTVTLHNDLDLGNIKSWVPIGFNNKLKVDEKGNTINEITNNTFKGTFDGNGYIISNLNITGAIKYPTISSGFFHHDYGSKDWQTGVGFFGCVNNATIKNLCLLNPNISISDYEADGKVYPVSSYIGTLIGAALGQTTVEQCMVVGGSVTVNHGPYNGDYTAMTTDPACAGGLIGGIYNTADKEDYAAKIKIDNTAVLDLSINYTMYSSNDNYSNSVSLGGLIGTGFFRFVSVDISNSYFYGSFNVSALGGAGENNTFSSFFVGGLVGYLYYEGTGNFSINIKNSISYTTDLVCPGNATTDGSEQTYARAIDPFSAGRGTYIDQPGHQYVGSSYNGVTCNNTYYIVGTEVEEKFFNTIDRNRPSNIKNTKRKLSDFEYIHKVNHGIPSIYSTLGWSIDNKTFENLPEQKTWLLCPVPSAHNNYLFELPVLKQFCRNVKFIPEKNELLLPLGEVQNPNKEESYADKKDQIQILPRYVTFSNTSASILETEYVTVHGYIRAVGYNGDVNAFDYWKREGTEDNKETEWPTVFIPKLDTDNSYEMHKDSYIFTAIFKKDEDNFELILPYESPSYKTTENGEIEEGYEFQTKTMNEKGNYYIFTYWSQSVYNDSEDHKWMQEDGIPPYKVQVTSRIKLDDHYLVDEPSGYKSKTFKPRLNLLGQIEYVQKNNILYIYSFNKIAYSDSELDIAELEDVKLEFNGEYYYPIIKLEYIEINSGYGDCWAKFIEFVGDDYDDKKNDKVSLNGKSSITMAIYSEFKVKEIDLDFYYDCKYGYPLGDFVQGEFNGNPLTVVDDITEIDFQADDDPISIRIVPAALTNISDYGYVFEIRNGDNYGYIHFTIKNWVNGENMRWRYRLDNGEWVEVVLGEEIIIDLCSIDFELDICIIPEPIEYEMDLWTGFNTESQPEEKSVLFNYLSDPIDLYKYAPSDRIIDGYEKSFGSWLIAVNQSSHKIIDYKGNVVTDFSYYTEDNSLIIYEGSLSNPDKRWIFELSDNNQMLTALNGRTYYVVISLLTGSYGNLRTEDGDNPIVITKWSNTYLIKIDAKDTNSGTNIWNNLSTPTDYYGVGGKSDTNKNPAIVINSNTSLTLYVKYGSDKYNFSFMRSNSMSMYNRTYFAANVNGVKDLLPSNKDGFYYYIFKYGYEITGYSIQFKYKGTTYYLIYNGSTWMYTYNSTYIPIDNLTNVNLGGMAGYAEYLDDLFVGGLPSNTVINVIPIWSPVNVQIIQGRDKILWRNGRFNEYYTADTTSPHIGKSLAYFLNGEEYVMPSNSDVPFNYYNLQYEYNSLNNIYKLYVSPVYVDNVYKVNLKDFKSSEANTYTLTNTDYKFSSAKSINHKVRYNHLDYNGYETFANSGNYFATDYSKKMFNVINNYLSAIESGSHNLLRKVFYTSGSATDENTKLIASNPTLYIFLANDQNVGNLPIFVTEYKTLIYWINSTDINKNTWAYTTADYNQIEHGEPPYNTHTGIWQLKDNYKGNDGNNSNVQVNFTAFYFRKVYDLEVTTQQNVLGVGQYGYVVIDIIDVSEDADTAEDKSAKYLIIYLDNGMKYYDITNTTFSSLTNTRINNLPEVDEIKLYAGCDVQVTIYDQSKDPSAMLTGEYSDMIGFRYASTISSLIDVLASSEYEYFEEAEKIEQKNLRTGSAIQLAVCFEYIMYDVSIVMSSGDATEGRFAVTYPNGVVSGLVSSATINDLKVGDSLQIAYKAYSGYEFAPNAFTMIVTNKHTGKSTTITLATYAELKALTSQTYTFTLDGNWLLTNYYKLADQTFSVVKANLGKIIVNTAEIEFDYFIRLIDYTTGEELEDRLVGKWQISDKTVNLSSAFTETEGVGYVIKIGNKSYAAVNSYAYKPRQPNSTIDHYEVYSFLLNEIPTKAYSISSDLLSNMTMSTVYEILADDLRQIYMVIIVGEIVEIKFSVEEVEHDPGLERTITISNGNENVSRLTLTSNYTATNSIYTYVGLKNFISLTYNENAYSGATYTYNDIEVMNEFSVTDGGELLIKFIPKAIQVRVETFINEAYADISHLVDIQYAYAEELYFCKELGHTDGIITIKFTQKSLDYDLYIYVNDILQTQSYTVGTPTTIQYRVRSTDYERGEIYIKVIEEEHDNNSITVEYALLNSRLSTPFDNYGTYNILIDGKVIEEENIIVYEGRKLQLSLDINTGYTYYGVMHNNGQIEDRELNGNVLTISESFRIEQGGRYRIYLEKTRLNAELRIVGDTHKTYTMDTNQTNGDGIEKIINQDRSIIRLNNLYLGKIITLSRTQEDKTEQFNYYYYDSIRGQIILESNTIEITSELLEELRGDLIIYVCTTPKYKIKLNIQSGERYINVDREQFYANGDYVYYPLGTELNLEITSIEEERYVITLTGDVNASGYSINEEIVITKDMQINVIAEPRTYAVTVEEFLYNSIDSIEEGAIQVEADPLEMSGQRYQESATITIQVEKTDRRLYEIELTIYGITIKINLESGEIVSEEENTYINGILNIEGKEIGIEIGESVNIKYITEGEVGLIVYYKSIEEILPQG